MKELINMFTITCATKTETLCIVVEGDFYIALHVAIRMVAAAREPLTSLLILPGAHNEPIEVVQALTQMATDLKCQIEAAKVIRKGSFEGN